MLAGAVGVVAGLGAIAFHWLCHLVAHFGLDGVAGYHSPGPSGEEELFSPFGRHLVPVLLLVVPTVGGLISGFLVFSLAPKPKGTAPMPPLTPTTTNAA